MNTREFDVLEHAADHDGTLFWIRELSNIGNAIHVHFGRVFEEFVHQYWSLGRGFNGEAHIMLKLAIGIDDLHRASAENEAGADKDRIPESFGRRESFRLIRSDAIR